MALQQAGESSSNMRLVDWNPASGTRTANVRLVDWSQESGAFATSSQGAWQQSAEAEVIPQANPSMMALISRLQATPEPETPQVQTPRVPPVANLFQSPAVSETDFFLLDDDAVMAMDQTGPQ